MEKTKFSKLNKGDKFKHIERDGSPSKNTYIKGSFSHLDEVKFYPDKVKYWHTYLYEYYWAESDEQRFPKDIYTGIMNENTEVYKI